MTTQLEPAVTPASSDATEHTERALEGLRAGRLAVLFDDLTAVPQGYLVGAAATATTEAVAFVVRHTSGFVEVAISDYRAAELDLPPMLAQWRRPGAPSLSVTVDAAVGGTTGISAADRARTVRLLGATGTRAEDFLRPGHVAPITVHAGLGLTAGGASAAALQLVFAAELGRGALMAAVVGTDDPVAVAGRDELERFATRWELPFVTVSELCLSLGSRTFTPVS